MANFLDLPLELRSQIYCYLIDQETLAFGSDPLLPKIHRIFPAILHANKLISYEAGLLFYRENPVHLWVEIECDRGDKIEQTLNSALAALFEENLPRSWQCYITLHVSYGKFESEFYDGRLILFKNQERYPTLSGAPQGREILEGWRQWFSGCGWYIKGLFASSFRRSMPIGAPTKNSRSRRDRSWRLGTMVAGEDFVKYLERLLPEPSPLSNSGPA